MAVKYSGTNPRFVQLIRDLNHNPIASAVATGRFRSQDKANRERYPLTAALLDVMVAPYSRKLHIWHHRQCLIALKKKCNCNYCQENPGCSVTAVELDFIDIETEDL